MMEVPKRWTPRARTSRCGEGRMPEKLGMTEQDTKTIADFLRKRQAGKRLVPQRSYKGFRFSPPVE